MKSVSVIGCSGSLRDLYKKVPSLCGKDVGFGRGDIAIVALDDRAVPWLSRNLDLFYPADVAEKLIRKDTMPGFLGKYGFPTLETFRVRSLLEIGARDFILKPILGSGCNSWSGLYFDAAYKKFESAEHLADVHKVSNTSIVGGYVVQEAVMSDEHTTASVGGTVNARGDVMFVRSALSYWRGGVRYKSVRAFKTPAFDQTKVLLREFIAAENIRCAAFSLQLIEKSGVFYPIDWNFHLAAPYIYDAVRTQPEEFYAAIHHMMGHTERFTEPSSQWEVMRCEESNNPDLGIYLKNSLVLHG